MNLQIPTRIKSLSKFIIFHLVLFSLGRLAFYFIFANDNIILLDPQTLKGFYLGLKFDLRWTLILLAPLFLLGWLPFLDFLFHNNRKKWWSWFYTLIAVFWTLIYAVDFANYSYLNTRVSAGLITFLYNPLISFGMVWQNYPILWSLLGLLIFLIIYHWCIKNFVFSFHRDLYVFSSKRSGPYLNWKKRIFIYSSFFLLFAGGIYGKLSYYPLRWSEAKFTADPFLSSLGSNPILHLQNTIRFKDKNFEIEKVKKHYNTIAEYLGVEDKNPQTLNFKRSIPGKELPQKPNVVLIVMESLATFKTSLSENPLDPTPHIKNIANESTYFSNYYVPSEGTARSMFGMMSAVPDISKTKTASRNPLVVDQNVLINAYDGYEKFYFIGGSASWGNIRGVFTNNIDGLNVMEEGSYTLPRTDVWGLSDLDLLKEANTVFSKTKEPFVAVVQCASFHRPYTIPENKDNFEEKSLSEKLTKEDLKSAGFISLKEYNSIRFSDYSLGHFWKIAKKSPYFKNTIFVITGDHGLPNLGADHVSKKLIKLEKDQFHVPLIIHQPEFLQPNQPQEIKKMASEVDVMTTMASLAGVPHVNTSIGRDLFNPKFDDNRFAFTYLYHRNPVEYGLIGKEHYFKTDTTGKDALYSLTSPEMIDLKTEKSELFKEMKNLANGIYETSRYLLHHNKKIKKASKK